MTQIDQKEAVRIREKFPEVHIRRTANKYYVEEVPKVMAFIGRCVNTRGGARYAANKAARRK